MSTERASVNGEARRSTSRRRACSTGSRARLCRARAALDRLFGEGVSLEELREAVESARLTLLPAERALAGDGPTVFVRGDRRALGLDHGLLQRATAALGIPATDPDEGSLTTADLEAAPADAGFLDAGLPEDGLLQVARTIGIGPRDAEANRELIVRAMMARDTERDLALRFAAAAEHMMPLFEPTLVYALRSTCSSRSGD